MATKIHNTVKICGIPHTIIEKDYIEGDGCVLGEVEYRSCTISMRIDQTPEMYRNTLIHEMCHAMLVMIGRNDLSENEQFVQTLALAISQTFDLKEDNNDTNSNTT